MATISTLSEEKKDAVFVFGLFLFQLYNMDCTTLEKQHELSDCLFDFCKKWYGYGHRGNFMTELDYWMLYQVKCDNGMPKLRNIQDINTYVIQFARELAGAGLKHDDVDKTYSMLNDLKMQYDQVLPPDSKSIIMTRMIMITLYNNLTQMGALI